LITQDLETAFRAIGVWRTNYGPLRELSRDERAVSLALVRDAVIQFVGCFDKTAEFSLVKEEVYPSDDRLAYFNWLRDLRDSYAAHKFGPYRQCAVGVDLSGPARRIRFVHQMYRGPQLGEQLEDFILIATKFAATRMLALVERLLRSLDSITDEELNALPIAELIRSRNRKSG
jgi:hypothetical protein